ncbi:polyprotein [Streptomyces sp. NBRC 110611]|uniref:hypothetical protein n=1 Tax=Streptomyces sp. NBRC 110611 TaxID=1621259 RepID=UPI00082F4861|nr:hypothetical protein [Streptomyces sp. NBRC 110611]GAU70273.1 polyprotein [Streptomyces sp. NBRC 110611]
MESAVTVELPALTAHGELTDGSGLFEHAEPGLGKNGTGRLSFLCDLWEGAFVVAGALLKPLEIAGVPGRADVAGALLRGRPHPLRAAVHRGRVRRVPTARRACARLTTQITTGDSTPGVEAADSLLLNGPESSLMELDLVADRNPESTSWTATRAAQEGITLGEALAPLLPTTAAPTAGLPNLLPAVEKISLRYTSPTAADAASLVLTTDTRQAQAVLVVTD